MRVLKYAFGRSRHSMASPINNTTSYKGITIVVGPEAGVAAQAKVSDVLSEQDGSNATV